MFVQEEIGEKKKRVRSLLAELQLSGVYLKKQHNFSWLTGGGLNVVGITLEMGVAGLLITPEREYAICNNIERPRMEKEEDLPGQGYELRSFPWHEDREAELVRELGGPRIGADHAFPGGTDVSARLNPLRFSLTPWEVERYKVVGELPPGPSRRPRRPCGRGTGSARWSAGWPSGCGPTAWTTSPSSARRTSGSPTSATPSPPSSRSAAGPCSASTPASGA